MIEPSRALAVAPRPFRLSIPVEVLDDLGERLSRTRWPDEIPASGWRYGSSLSFMRRVTERWHGFDWRAQEARLKRSISSVCSSPGSTSTSSISGASARSTPTPARARLARIGLGVPRAHSAARGSRSLRR